MCGRFVQVEKPEFYAEHFGAEFVRTETLKQSYNVAPTSQVYAIADHEHARVRAGLVVVGEGQRQLGAAVAVEIAQHRAEDFEAQAG